MNVAFDRDWFLQLKRADISTLSGWQDFVDTRNRYVPPTRLTREARAQLSGQDRGMYDLARQFANVNLGKYDTPMTESVRDQVEPLLQANLMSLDPGVRGGIFVSADGGVGKSTIIREIVADFDNQVRGLASVAPTLVNRTDRWVPVAWVTVPPQLTIRALACAILEFYQVPYPKSDSAPELTRKVVRTLQDCGTIVLVLDEITRFKNNEPDRFASDWLRNLMETSVSIVAMGVDVRGSGILYDGKTRREQQLRTQTARRFPVIEMDPFTYDADSDILAWKRHLRAIERDLFLLDRRPGMLSEELAEFLWLHTAGVVGVLSRWVSITALRVVGRSESRGGEYLTREDFLKVPVPTVDSLKDDITIPGSTIKDAAARLVDKTGDAPPSATSQNGRKRKNGSKSKGNTMYQQTPRDRSTP